MAKIINLFNDSNSDMAATVEKKNDWRKVLTGKEYNELSYGCFNISSKWDFPACNHSFRATSDNIGYVQGMLIDNRPFEAELFIANNECVLGLIMPVVKEIKNREERDKVCNSDFLKNKKGNVLGFTRKAEFVDNGILTLLMLKLDEETNLNVLNSYVAFLEEMGIVKFLTAERNCYIEYYNDINGTDLVRILIALEYDNSEVVATTPLRFRQFNKKEIIDAYSDGVLRDLDETEEKNIERSDKKLTNRVLGKYEPKDIAFIEFVEEGACGVPGNISIYVKEKNKGVCYSGNNIYDNDISIKKIEKLMAPLLSSNCFNGLTKDPFKHYYMGMGNHWYVNRKYSNEVDFLKEVLNEDGLFSRKKIVAYMLLDRV